MKLMKITILLLSLLTIASCQTLLEHDFKKATFVGEVEFGSTEIFEQTLSIPRGESQLVLAISNYNCVAMDDATITISIRGPNQVRKEGHYLLSQFTWSYGQDSCDAIGYIKERAQNIHENTFNDLRLKLSRNELVTG